jgi:hypothetical protein
MSAQGRTWVAWLAFTGLVIDLARSLVLPQPTPAPQAIIRPRVPVPTGASGFERALAAAREGRMQAWEVVWRAMEEQGARAATNGSHWREKFPPSWT